MNGRRTLLTTLARLLALLVMITGLAPAVSAAPSPAPVLAPSAAPLLATNTLTLNVVDATTGNPISPYEFKYIINIDNTGTTEQRSPDPGTGCNPGDAGYPDSCEWVSVAGAASNAPIFTQGDQGDFGAGINLPDGRYLISVLADGYKLDGTHFTVPLADPGQVTVELQPWDLPTATIQAEVFQDSSPVNSAPDVPAERGIPGFQAHIADYLGEVTTDVFGDPLCGNGICLSKCYNVDAQGNDTEVAPASDGLCPVGSQGKVKIPNVGPNRYALSVVPPDGSNWIQTTTLEGNHDWDAWVMEGATGLDTEFVVAGEPFPATFFGYVRPTNSFAGSGGHIKGIVDAVKVYVPTTGGLGLPGSIWGGLTGGKIDKPIDSPWIALSDLNNGDTAVYVGQGNADGSFDIAGVPDGTYTLTWWDEPQDYILDLQNVTVVNGETVDLGVLPLTGWWTQLEGYVFNDLNRNGVRDPGEPGLANFPVAMRKRENSLMDRGAVLVTTDANGYYYMENAYPMTQWLIMEAYSDLYYTTGVTYQADNQAEPTTILGAGVDVSVLPIIGLSGRLDWGVHNYAPTGGTPGVDPDNGGIVGTVSYDTTRNEIDPRYAAVEDWQPGIPNLTVNLYAPVDCPTDGSVPCDATGRYQLDTDGSFLKGSLLNSYLTETWQRPGLNADGFCVPRDVNGDPLAYPADQQITSSATDCLEAPLMGVQFQAGFSTVDGNYGFADGCFGAGGATDPETCADGSEPTPLTVGDYLVDVVIPDDATGRPMYQVTKEEDINIANGDQFVPQIPPPECAGPLHTVDVAGIGTDGWAAIVGDGTNGVPVGVIVPASTPVVNKTFADALGGSYYEGQPKPLCSTKLVRVSNGRSVAPTFNLFTDVPLPGRFWGLIVDDLNFSSNPKSITYGEKAGVPFAPVGIYDYTNRLVYTTESDYNGLFDVLLPSTNRISCPTPSGVCANLYRFVGNDPGIPGRLNPNYNPNFRTIAAEFEAFPGLLVPADLAPTQVGVTVQLPGGQVNSAALCTPEATTPQLFAVSKPYADFRTSSQNDSFTIDGQGFGAPGEVTLDGAALPTSNWTDTSIDVTVPANTPVGPHQLEITTGGQTTVNGLTFHVLGLGPFPSTPVLDNFNRTGFGNNWQADNAFSLSNNNVRVAGSGNNSSGTMRWRGSAGGGPDYGANQEAYFTFVKVSPTATEQGLFLKVTGSGNNPNPTSNGSAYIEVSYKGNSPTSVQVRTKANGTNTVVLQATFPTTFAASDTLGARALSDGTVIAYKNAVEIGRVNVAAAGWPNTSGGGRLGIRFVGVQNNTTNDARFDNFGGGTVVGYAPNVYEVGEGKAYAPLNLLPDGADHAIQRALDDAAASPGDDLVVVYPGLPDSTNARQNPRGAYYENLIITKAVKLQGVGPGGFQGNTFVPGSIIDGGAFGGDSPVFTDWYTTISGLTWNGNQTIYDGAPISIFTHDGDFGSAYKASIDGFDIRGGDQQGFPGNINQIGGGPTGAPAGLVTQGGAIFANAYARYLQITNNVVENNGGAYGTIRVGTPNLPAPDTNQHNENVRIANNRIIANAGTNLAGGIGLFAGSDNYEVAGNEICGNFSAEYGGGMTVYGLSPSGKIHHNRVYFNRSYDEGGGIMIAGELPADPAAVSPGSGGADIYNNLIEANLGNDDGGGLRFLMAGNFPFNVYNNMIVNNVSTHEGGGISLNDAPNVRVFNNTIMKNITTATAVTSNGSPAPAGLSSSANSDQLQATLPVGSPLFSNPLMLNNIFWDNRAGARSLDAVTGIGALGDATPVNYWDLGVADVAGASMSPTYSIIQAGDGAGAATNPGTDPAVMHAYDLGVTFNAWRNNPNFIGAILVAVELPTSLNSNYHLGASTSPAYNAGWPSKDVPSYQQPPAAWPAPLFDFDDDTRPAVTMFDIGADEFVPAP